MTTCLSDVNAILALRESRSSVKICAVFNIIILISQITKRVPWLSDLQI